MEVYLRQRIDCPPPGGTRSLIEEKDQIIKKQQEQLKQLEQQIEKVQLERDQLFSLLSDEQKSNFNHSCSSHFVSMKTRTPEIEPTEHFQISKNLEEKQIEILERKYGGHLRCRRAATTIQRAFRQYKMKKNFRHLCATAKVNKRLSCCFIESSRIEHLKTLKSCLKTRKNDEHESRTDSKRENPSKTFPLDLPSINFEHFVESSRDEKRSKNGKRVFIVTDRSLDKTNDESIETLSDFVDGNSSNSENNWNADFPIEQYDFSDDQQTNSVAEKPIPPIRTLSLTSRTVLTTNLSTICPPSKSCLSISSPINDIKQLADLLTDHLNKEKTSMVSPTSTISSDRDSFSLQSTSTDSNRTSLNSFDLASRSSLSVDDQNLVPPFERFKPMENDEIHRRRSYRVALTLFNTKPQQGIRYLIGNGFVENNPQAIGQFLLSRKGLSRQMIGEYLGNLQDPLAMKVLKAFTNEFDLHQIPIDVALRKFQASFRLPGEAQKIERLMKVFSQRFCESNFGTSSAGTIDTIFILAFAIIMLNTDLHSRNIKPERKMRLEEFIKNLRAIDDGENLDVQYLTSIYERIRLDELRSDPDHVSQVLQFEQTFVGKKPALAATHRRLVCFCRFYQVFDVNKREKFSSHQREVFLFNDLLVVTKLSGKKNQQFRQAIRLSTVDFCLFETIHFPHGVRLVRKSDSKETVLITLNARNEHDRRKFCDDLRETILEATEFERVLLESQMEKVRSSTTIDRQKSDVLSSLIDLPTVKRDRPLSRTLSNSLLDLNAGVSKQKSSDAFARTGVQTRIPYRSSKCSLDRGLVSLSNEFSSNKTILMH